MRRRLNSGTSLIEVLTVIVVFLVGILGLLQAFPSGLGLLRTTRSNTLAAALARAEMQRIQASVDVLPEMIVPVTYRAGGTVIEVNAGIPWTDLMPERDPSGGQLDVDGNILIGGSPIGAWQRVSGANKFNRVIGEGRRVPGPTTAGGFSGSLLQLQYAPIYYSRSASTGIANPGLLSVYANDLLRRWGNPQRGRPNPSTPGREFEFFFVEAENAEDAPFSGEDQIWVPIPRDRSGAAILAPLRINLAFTYDRGGAFDQHEVIVVVDPADAPSSVLVVGANYIIVNLRNLIAEPGVYGPSGFDPAQFAGAEGTSLRVQRMYREIPLNQAFTSGDPFQYKALNGAMGTILINPSASLYRMAQPDGTLTPLEANTDYTVLDWRLMRDAFRIPDTTAFPTLRLALGGIKPMSTPDTDGTPYEGLGFFAPDGDNNPVETDFTLIDELTGGVILGNNPGMTYNSYFVDKRNGAITFIDRDTTTPGVQVYLAVPSTAGGWDAPALIDASRRSVRALYQATGEWAVQMHKAANAYRVSGFVGPSGLQPGECLMGGIETSPGVIFGSPSRLYFPVSDLGHRVSVGEIRVTQGGNHRALRDQELSIRGTETVNGILMAYADIASATGAGATFDATRTGYAVRGVKGASFRVRVMWNPERFPLLPDAAENYSQLEQWQRSTRPIQTEGFVSPGDNQ
jgi:hypothetical protein